MSFKAPKPDPVAPPPPQPNLAEAGRAADDQRRRRLQKGGRNATFLASIMSENAASGSAGPAKTLTGLQG